MKTLFVTLVLLFSTTTFAAKVSDTFKKTNLEMMVIVLSIIEPDDTPYSGVNELSFSASKPKTVTVRVKHYKVLDQSVIEEIQKDYLEEVNSVASMLGVSGHAVKFDYQKIEL